MIVIDPNSVSQAKKHITLGIEVIQEKHNESVRRLRKLWGDKPTASERKVSTLFLTKLLESDFEQLLVVLRGEFSPNALRTAFAILGLKSS